MRRTSAAVGAAVFFAVAPGVVAGVVPWYLTRGTPSARVSHGWLVPGVGVVLIVLGVTVLVYAFVSFVVQGIGTPAPVAPTEELVVTGLYLHVRNPMYLAVVAIIGGEAVTFGSTTVLSYGAVAGAAMAAFARWYEEPALSRRFGARYDAYRRAVPAWRPRVRPWRPTGDV